MVLDLKIAPSGQTIVKPTALGPVLFFTLNREDFSFVIHLDRQPRTSRRREAQTGSRARSGSRSERTLDAVEHSRTLMEWWPFLIFHRGGLRIKVINNTRSQTQTLKLLIYGLFQKGRVLAQDGEAYAPGSANRPGGKPERFVAKQMCSSQGS